MVVFTKWNDRCVVYAVLKVYRKGHRRDPVVFCNYSEPCEMKEKNANHACMNERSFLSFHMARSKIEMQRSEIEMGL